MICKHIVLCGLGKIGQKVLQLILETGAQVTVIDRNIPLADRRPSEQVRYLEADFRQKEQLLAAGVDQAEIVLILTSDDLANISTAMMVRNLNTEARLIIRMFNQNLLERMRSVIKNVVAVSVSAATAPLIALMAITGEMLSAIKIGDQTLQIAEIRVESDSPLARKSISTVCDTFQLQVLAVADSQQQFTSWDKLEGRKVLQPEERIICVGRPETIESLLAYKDTFTLKTVRFAGRLKRWFRSVDRTFAMIDTTIRAAILVLFLSIFVGTMVLRYGTTLKWWQSFFQAISILGAGEDLDAADPPEWVQIAVGAMKVIGPALLAWFTAILTNYLLRARLGSVMELTRIPDEGHVVVCGLGNVGYRTVEALLRLGQSVVVIEQQVDGRFVAAMRRKGVPVITGDATLPDIMKQARVTTARAVILTTSSDLLNLELGVLVLDLNPLQRVVLRLTDSEFAASLRQAAGLKLAASVPELAAPTITAAIFGDTVQTLAKRGDQFIAIMDLIVDEREAHLVQKSLTQLMIDYQFLPLGLSSRAPFSFSGIPGSYRLQTGDRLTIAIDQSHISKLFRPDLVARNWQLMLISCLDVAKADVIPLVRTYRQLSWEQAEEQLTAGNFVLAEGISLGEAVELQEQLSRHRVKCSLSEKNT